MARKWRVECAGALYRVINRRNHGNGGIGRGARDALEAFPYEARSGAGGCCTCGW